MPTAIETLSWDIDALDGGASRPSLDDHLGGAILENDPEENGAFAPPTDGTYPEAVMLNQRAKQIAAVGRMVGSARMTIDCTSGSAVKVALMAPGLTVVLDDFTITPNGAGDYTVSWPAGKLPPMSCDPDVSTATNAAYSVAAIASATSVRVKSYVNNVLTNARWTLTIN